MGWPLVIDGLAMGWPLVIDGLAMGKTKGAGIDPAPLSLLSRCGLYRCHHS